MREHYDRLETIQHLVIRADLFDVHAIAKAIGQGTVYDTDLERWSGQAALVSSAASVLAAARSNESACRGTAQLALACALCHVDTKVVGMFGSPPPAPRDDASVAARMARHVWATDRLFEGMIGAADDSWNAGLDVLAQTPSPIVADDTSRAAGARRLQELAATAKRASKRDLMARARLYGEILVACSDGHTGERARGDGAPAH